MMANKARSYLEYFHMIEKNLKKNIYIYIYIYIYGGLIIKTVLYLTHRAFSLFLIF